MAKEKPKKTEYQKAYYDNEADANKAMSFVNAAAEEVFVEFAEEHPQIHAHEHRHHGDAINDPADGGVVIMVRDQNGEGPEEQAMLGDEDIEGDDDGKKGEEDEVFVSRFP